MTFLATYWYLFLIIWIISLFYTCFNQIMRIKRMVSSVENEAESFFKGIYCFIAGIAVTGVSFALMIIGVLANIFAS